MKRVIEIIGWTSKQEVRASAWISFGVETVYQLACVFYRNKKLAEKVYGKDSIRKLRIRINEVKEDK